MPQDLTSLRMLARLPFDTVIDVRSPAEYAEDHVPGAINLPALSNAERAIVGTIYKQEDPFKARKIGGAMVARNAAQHLDGPLAAMPGGWRPLVYCWRGGQRSGAFTSILQQIGWRADVVRGGYKAYRRLVVQALYQQPVAQPIVLVDGGTGCAKTEILAHLAQIGAQVLDLEGMANHRGSVFGNMGAQPAQKMFESRIAMALAEAQPERPLYIEAESYKVGDLLLPPMLWQAMQGAKRVVVHADLPSRAQFLAHRYTEITSDAQRLAETLQALRPYHGAEQLEAWQDMAQTRQFVPLAEQLIAQHYDPRYGKKAASRAPAVARVNLANMQPPALQAAAMEIVSITGK